MYYKLYENHVSTLCDQIPNAFSTRTPSLTLPKITTTPLGWGTWFLRNKVL